MAKYHLPARKRVFVVLAVSKTWLGTHESGHVANCCLCAGARGNGISTGATQSKLVWITGRRERVRERERVGERGRVRRRRIGGIDTPDSISRKYGCTAG